MGDIHILDVETTLDIPADRVLDAEKDGLDTAIVIGYDKDGQYYFSSSTPDSAKMLWLVEKFKAYLLSEPDVL